MVDLPGYTVVIPTRDRYDMLARALASVAAQTLLPERVIIADNSSQPAAIDGRALTLKGVQFEALRVPHAVNAAAVRNCGLRYAQTRYVAFLDDDDAWLPEKMQRQLAFLLAHPECGVVVCGRLIVSPSSRYVEIPTTAGIAALLPYDNFGGSFSFITFDREGCTGLHIDERLEAFQDWDFLLRAARGGAIGAVPEVLAVYHDHPAARITRKIAGRRQALRWLHAAHRPYLHRDARRWMVSREWDLRAQESFARGSWQRTCRCVWQSLRWGWHCQLPGPLKYRSLGRRLSLLLPPRMTARLGILATNLKARLRPNRLQDSSV
jgi:glycosyltransferase involved in cell wall biosynthesis